MATVTETYILEQDEGETTYPSSTITAFEAAKTSGVIVSSTKTAISTPSEVVEGKARFNVTIVWRSAEDKTNYENARKADSTFQNYLTTSNTRKVNLTIS